MKLLILDLGIWMFLRSFKGLDETHFTNVLKDGQRMEEREERSDGIYKVSRYFERLDVKMTSSALSMIYYFSKV